MLQNVLYIHSFLTPANQSESGTYCGCGVTCVCLFVCVPYSAAQFVVVSQSVQTSAFSCSSLRQKQHTQHTLL